MKDKTIVWTKYENKEIFSPLFIKYNLHHDNPLIEYFSGDAYVKNPFICFDKASSFDYEWRFWNWEWYFFKDMPRDIIDDCHEIAFSLFDYLNQHNLPIEEVQDMYKEFVRIFDDEKKRTQFCFDFIDSHEKQATIDLVANITKTGKMPSGNTDWFDIGRRIMKYRSDFPDDLPTAVMDEMSHTYLVFGDWDWHPGPDQYDLLYNNLLNNYLLRPTECNALHAILLIVSDYDFFPRHRLSYLDEAFAILHKHGFLEKWVLRL